MPEKDQKMRFIGSELSLMKSLFAENESLLFTFRKFLLGFELNEGEKNGLKMLQGGAGYALMKKMFLPEIDPSAPLFQLVDMTMGLNIDFKGNPEANAQPFIEAKLIEENYLKERFATLQTTLSPVTTLKELARLDSENAYVNIIARNYLLSYIDSSFQQIVFLAGKKEETVEETIERLQKNSNK